MAKRKGLGHMWEARTKEVDFLKDQGGFFGAQLNLDLDNALKFSKNISDAVKMAKNPKFNKNMIEIHAHWGKKTRYGRKKRDLGFLLKTKVHE